MGWSTRELAGLAGTSLRTVRHYHDVGLLAEPERHANGYKSYRVEHLVRVMRIKRLSDLGFSLAQIAEMGDADEYSDQALRTLDAELAETVTRLQRVRAELALVLRKDAPTDLPPELATIVAGADMAEADRSLLVVWSRLVAPEALDSFNAALQGYQPGPAENEFRAPVPWWPSTRRFSTRRPWPPTATAEFQKIAQGLIDEPVPTSDGRELTYTAAIDAVVAGLYSEQSWPTIIEGIAEVKDGSGDTLMGLRDGYHQRNPDGTYANFSEALLAIDCMDEERHTPEQETSMKEDVFEAAPFMDTGRPVNARNACENWPVEPTLDYPYATDIDEDLPATLVVSITGDPATPHEGALTLAEALGSNVLTVKGEQHGVALVGGNACVDGFVADYLLDPDNPPEGAECGL